MVRREALGWVGRGQPIVHALCRANFLLLLLPLLLLARADYDRKKAFRSVGVPGFDGGVSSYKKACQRRFQSLPVA